LWHHTAGAVAELHKRGHRQLALIVSQVQEYAIFAEKAAVGAVELPLLFVRFAGDVGRLGVKIGSRT